jgi:PAS domain S-box-containing protein
MTTPDRSEQAPEPPQPSTVKQVDALLGSPELVEALERDDFKRFLDHVPIAIIVSRLKGSEPRIVYVNAAFERLTGQTRTDVEGRGLAVLEGFVHEDNPTLTLSGAAAVADEFLGTFAAEQAGGQAILVEAYAALIESEDIADNYRVVALVDVSARERAQREEFERQIRDKDLMLKELQHRVKNNLQLITALIRLEARNARGGEAVNLDRLAGRIESLQLLYQAMSGEAWGHELDLGHYVSQIASAIVRTHALDSVQLDLKVNYCPVSINVAMPVGLIVNELLTNAFKYAFVGRESGTITLECLRETEFQYRVVVADDGTGLPPGVEWPGAGKLSALIVQTLRENAKTALEVRSAPGEGTEVTIAFTHQPPSARAN